MFCNVGWDVEDKVRQGMNMRTIWRIQVEVRNQGYDLAHWVEKTPYGCKYPLDQDSYLPYGGSLIDLCMIFS